MKHFLATFGLAVDVASAFCGIAATHGGAHTKSMRTIRTRRESEIVVVPSRVAEVIAVTEPKTRYFAIKGDGSGRDQLRIAARVVLEFSDDVRNIEEVHYRVSDSFARDYGAGDE